MHEHQEQQAAMPAQLQAHMTEMQNSMHTLQAQNLELRTTETGQRERAEQYTRALINERVVAPTEPRLDVTRTTTLPPRTVTAVAVGSEDIDPSPPILPVRAEDDPQLTAEGAASSATVWLAYAPASDEKKPDICLPLILLLRPSRRRYQHCHRLNTILSLL